eukprot:3749282-Pyramimonas_sp.AAC.1
MHLQFPGHRNAPGDVFGWAGGDTLGQRPREADQKASKLYPGHDYAAKKRKARQAQQPGGSSEGRPGQ